MSTPLHRDRVAIVTAPNGAPLDLQAPPLTVSLHGRGTEAIDSLTGL